MTKPVPTSRANSQVLELEIDAMDRMEWQHGQRTPQASDANLAALVKQSAKSYESARVAAGVARTPPVPRPRVTEAPPSGAARTTEAAPARPRAGSEPITPSRAPEARRKLPGPPRGSIALGERVDRPAPTRKVTAPGVRAKASPGAAFPPIATPPPAAHPMQPAILPMSVGGYPIYAPPAPAARRPDLLPSLYPRSPSDGLNDFRNDFRNDDQNDQNDSGNDRHKTVNARPSHQRLERLSSPDPLAISDVRLPLPENREIGEGRRTSSNRWLWWIVGVTIVIVVALAVIVLGSIAPIYTPASANFPPTPTEEASSSETSESSPAPNAAPNGAPAASPTPSTAAASPTTSPHPLPAPAAAPAGHPPAVPAVAAAVPAPTSPVYGAPSQPVARGVYRLGGKKVIIDYQTRAGDPVPNLIAQDSEDPAVARARSAYLTGNEKLFAGDATGAVAAYHEAIGLYPGYVGGYRGLGLAYAQLGQTKQALDALKTYVTAAPTAKDIALIKKRIARLQGK
ncbi:MAG TPA: tetratricopeptide repeat protein [Kofleriaceae bacterium]|nr:tetratricopeptide repeat protein [Kofleriaceae bacterium]